MPGNVGIFRSFLDLSRFPQFLTRGGLVTNSLSLSLFLCLFLSLFLSRIWQEISAASPLEAF